MFILYHLRVMYFTGMCQKILFNQGDKLGSYHPFKNYHKVASFDLQTCGDPLNEILRRTQSTEKSWHPNGYRSTGCGDVVLNTEDHTYWLFDSKRWIDIDEFRRPDWVAKFLCEHKSTVFFLRYGHETLEIDAMQVLKDMGYNTSTWTYKGKNNDQPAFELLDQAMWNHWGGLKALLESQYRIQFPDFQALYTVQEWREHSRSERRAKCIGLPRIHLS